MPITYSIDEASSVITVTLSGRFAASDIADYLAASRKDPAFRPEMHRLIVIGPVKSYPDSPDVREITSRHRGPAPSDVRIAAVVDTPIGRGMVSMFLGLWGLSDRYQFFTDVASARQWLVAS